MILIEEDEDRVDDLAYQYLGTEESKKENMNINIRNLSKA